MVIYRMIKRSEETKKYNDKLQDIFNKEKAS